MRYFFALLLPLVVFGQNHKSPQQIQKELDDAESQFKKSKEMFNPWYTGPLLTPSPTMIPPGYGNFQPYVFVTDNYASYNSIRGGNNRRQR